MLLLFAFLAIMAITFGTVALLTDATQREKIVAKRIDGILTTGPNAGLDQPEVQQLLKVERTSSFGWLNELLQRFQLLQMLEARILQANSKTTPAKLVISTIALGLVGFGAVTFFVHVAVLQVLGTCALAYIPFGLLSYKRSRRITAFNRALPDAIDMMGRALRAGHSMMASINIVAEQSAEPVRSEFNEVFQQQNFGLPLRDAMTQMLDRVPSQDLRVLVTGILVQKETGGNLAEILDRTAATIRERLKVQGEIRTHTAQGRLTGWILCALPLVMLVVINIVQPGYSKALTENPIGQKLSYAGGVLLVIGGLAIRQIINGIEV